MNQVFKNIILIFVLIFCTQKTLAEDVTDNIIRGKVYSATDGGLIMVNVVEIDQNNRIVSSAATDAGGNFSMKIKNKTTSKRYS